MTIDELVVVLQDRDSNICNGKKTVFNYLNIIQSSNRITAN